MKTQSYFLKALFVSGMILLFSATWSVQGGQNGEQKPTIKSASIPLDQLGTLAAKQSSGDGLAVSATAQGAHLCCAFQKLKGDATSEGLWLTSMLTNSRAGQFRVKAVALARGAPRFDAPRLPDTGTVSVDGQTVRYTRPTLVEEYSVSLDGVRQDFVLMQRPAGAGELQVRLALSGARVERAAGGAQLVLEPSGRKLTYGRLRATDATGRELAARMHVPAKSEIRNAKSEISLALVVNDAHAAYPVRIDPTFSDANWVGMGGVLVRDGRVYAMAMDALGNLYVGGSFNVAGDIAAPNVAKWDGTSWSALGSGMSGPVFALAVSGRDLYAGGSFTTAGGVAATNIAKWDGSAWSTLALGVSEPSYGGTVYALAASGNDLYAGGWFTTAGGVAATNIARWDGSSWSALGSVMGGSYPAVHALAVSGSDLYAGGSFTRAGDVAATNIAKWDGSSWSALGSGIGGYDDSVSALAVSGSDLYAGGGFTAAGDIAATNVAKWDGTTWSALGSGMESSYSDISALAVSGTDLYAAGGYGGGSVPVDGGHDGGAFGYVAKWDGSSWSALGSGMNDSVFALAASGSNLYAGGSFSLGIAKWDGNNWSALGSGMGGYPEVSVYALAVSGSDLYAGGCFTTLSGVATTNIAKWDESGWSALGAGIGDYPWSSSVSALAVSGSDVYAGGAFETAGGIPANNVAKWDRTRWSALGSGVAGCTWGSTFVGAMAVTGSDVYVGGNFTTAGGTAATNIAKWDGTRWSALGSGMGADYPISSVVSALAISGSNVYAGGRFTSAGGIAARNIAKWNGSRWSALGSGIGGDYYDSVDALVVSGGNLYAGGYFTIAGGIAASCIAKWDGRSWSALGSGMGGWPSVSALAVSGCNLYVGGRFTSAGGIAANCIAKWDGSGWSALGSGIGGSDRAVYALTVSGSELYAGGWFTSAGGKVSAGLTKAIVNPGNWLKLQLGVPGPNTNTLSYVGVPNAQYLIQFATNLTTSPWFIVATNTPAANGRGSLQDPAATDPQRFYRVGVP